MSPEATDTMDTAEKRPVKWAALLGGCLVLFVFVLVSGMKWSRESAAAAECRRRLEILGKRAEDYADRNAGAYPYGRRALEFLIAKKGHRSFLICPKSKRAYRWTGHERRRDDPPHLMLAWENPATPPHGLVVGTYHALFVGGRVRSMSRAELLRRLEEERREPPTSPKRPSTPRPGLRGGSGSGLPEHRRSVPEGAESRPGSYPPPPEGGREAGPVKAGPKPEKGPAEKNAAEKGHNDN